MPYLYAWNKLTYARDIPLSMRLSSLVSTESASLTLFYTSLYHTLNPTSRTPVKKSRIHPHQGHEIEPTTTSKAITPLSHVRSAPIRLVLMRPVSTRSHQSHLWHATVLRWPRTTLMSNTPSDKTEDEPDEIVVNLAVINNNSRPVGTDPRRLEEKWNLEGANRSGADQAGEARELVSTWEVGVWGDWSILKLPGGCAGVAGVEESLAGLKVLFASRYILAEKTT